MNTKWGWRKQNKKIERFLFDGFVFFFFTFYCLARSTGRKDQSKSCIVIGQLNPLTPRVKPWVIQSFLTFDSMDRTLKCDHSMWCCLFFSFKRLSWAQFSRYKGCLLITAKESKYANLTHTARNLKLEQLEKNSSLSIPFRIETENLPSVAKIGKCLNSSCCFKNQYCVNGKDLIFCYI